MSAAGVLVEGDPRVALDAAHAAVDDLLTADLTRLSEDGLLQVLRDTERLRRRLAAIDHAQILEVEARGLPAAHNVRTTGQFLRWVLRLDPGEAAGRVRAAEAAGTRRTVTGQVIEPAYPQVAAAQAAGVIGERQARVIVDTIEKLPDAIREDVRDEVEQTLVEHAACFDAKLLGLLGRRIHACYDPDGTRPDDSERQRRREFSLTQRPDGSSHGQFEATAELTERLLVLFDSLAGPRPEVDGIKDPRTGTQRRHDALLDALTTLQNSGALPPAGGLAATLVLTMTDHAYRTGTGLARTSHGALIPARDALDWAGGDHRLMAVVLDNTKGITAYSSLHRCFTEQQRLAMIARDGGCTFPHCDAPPGQCQAMHLTDHAITGHTRIDDGGLGCYFDHRERVKQGWKTRLINGRVAWIPPPWIDPHQKPQYNQLHRPLTSNDDRPGSE